MRTAAHLAQQDGQVLHQSCNLRCLQQRQRQKWQRIQGRVMPQINALLQSMVAVVLIQMPRSKALKAKKRRLLRRVRLQRTEHGAKLPQAT